MPLATPSVPQGLRLYAIGDIHGRVDLLETLMQKVDADRQSAAGTVQKIFLGDYVDRGLASRQVIDFLLGLRAGEKMPPIFLRGNHEQVMLALLRDPGNDELMEDWLRFGGRETLMSYGVRVPFSGGPAAPLVAALKAAMPPAHAEFLESLALHAEFGDYYFCHAGVRPGVALAAQAEQDLVWIRHDFLGHREPFGKIVVHGHTICREVEFRSNRIGIDTGAYATGCLTGLALEGNKRWLLQTV
ncbi:MAG TPA: metallophosphoesterase family protein [Alphaproteobacteria bacterium]|nr:metallophosphoesterase family protein [Alphaproteobacteria bacterium]